MRLLLRENFVTSLSDDEKEKAKKEFYSQFNSKKLPFYGGLYSSSHPRVIYVYRKPRTVNLEGKLINEECYLASLVSENIGKSN